MNPLCPEDKPCHATVFGAMLLTLWLYVTAFSNVFLGESLGAALGKVFAGDVLNETGLWLALLVIGISTLWTGLRAALSHNDPVNVGRAAPAGVGVLFCLWGVSHQIYVTDTAFSWHLSRALWLSVMASCAAEIWLETRGLFGRLRRRPVRNVPAPVAQQSYPVPVQSFNPVERHGWRRWVRRTEWTEGAVQFRQSEAFEETEWEGEAGALNDFPRPQGAAWLPEYSSTRTPARLPDASGQWPQVPYQPQDNIVALPKPRQRVLQRR
jgi:hypothetical protein